MFSLHNPTDYPIKGRVSLEGSPATVKWEQNRAQILVQSGSPRDIPLLPVDLAAGATALFDLSTTIEGAKSPLALRLRWQGPNGTSDEAVWKTAPAESGVSSAVIDAGAFRANPFHLIPVYHVYQYRPPTRGELNLRVVASEPTRIEFYDDQRKLVAVDAQGDGRLDAEGDSLIQDRDRNGIVDLVLPAQRNEITFLLMVRPLAESSNQDRELSVESLQEGTWRKLAVDTIRSANP